MKIGDTTRQRMLDAGLSILAESGMQSVTTREVGRRVDRPHSNVAHYFGNLAGLRSAVAAHAVATGASRAIARLILDGHPSVAGLSAADRARHLGS